MRTDKSIRIAYAALLTAISTIALILSFYIRYISIALGVVSAISIFILLRKGFIAESFIAYFATALLGLWISGGYINVLSFIVLYGLYPIVRGLSDKLSVKWAQYAIRIVYFIAIIYPLLLVSKLTGNVIYDYFTKSSLTIIGYSALFVAVMTAVDFGISYMMPSFDNILRRIDAKAVGFKKKTHNANNTFDASIFEKKPADKKNCDNTESGCHKIHFNYKDNANSDSNKEYNNIEGTDNNTDNNTNAFNTNDSHSLDKNSQFTDNNKNDTTDLKASDIFPDFDDNAQEENNTTSKNNSNDNNDK